MADEIQSIMKTLASVKKLALGLALGGLFAWQAGATVAYNNPTTVNVGNIQTPSAWVLGNEFNVNSTISVTAVGAFDYQANGFGGSDVQVAIYQLSDGIWNQVAGTFHDFTGTAGSQSYYVGSSAFNTLSTPVDLGVGTYAVVAANIGTSVNPDWNWNLGAGGPGTTFQNTTTAISMTSPNFAFYQSGTSLGPTLSGVSYGAWGAPNPTFGAGTFDFNFTPVPEAAGFALAGVALLGLVYVGRAYSQKLKVA